MNKKENTPGEAGIQELKRLGYYTWHSCTPVQEWVYMKSNGKNAAHQKDLKRFDRLLAKMSDDKFWADENRQPA